MSEHSHTVTPQEVQADLDSADKMVVSTIRCTVQHISRDEIESAIDTELAAGQLHRQRSAIADLRAGALFLCLKSQMGSGYSGFWKHCETRFTVNRATISRKMRLAVKWLAANGGNPKLITELAQAMELDPAKLKSAPKAVQLAFDWIGDQTTTDLYRKYKLVNYGPQNTGKLLGDPKLKRRLSDSEHGLAQQQKWVAEQWREPGFTRKELLRWLAPNPKTKVKSYLLLTDDELNEFAALLHDLHREICDARVGRGALKRKSL